MDAALSSALDTVEAGGTTNDVKPSPGWIGELVIPDTKLGEKDGDQYAVVEYRSADGQYNWSDFKYLTKGGYPHEGRIKSLKILLGSLGYPTITGATLGPIMQQLIGKRFTAEVVGSGAYAPSGDEYINTKILGAIAADAGPSPVQAQAPAPAQAFPPAVSQTAPVQSQQIPWDQPQQVAPAPVNAVTGG